MNVVISCRLYAPAAFTPEDIAGSRFSYGHSAVGMIKSMKNIGNPTRDFRVCSAVSYPTASL
jgi:hypothetical protein